MWHARLIRGLLGVRVPCFTGMYVCGSTPEVVDAWDRIKGLDGKTDQLRTGNGPGESDDRNY